MAAVRKPSKDVAHGTPRLWYMYEAKSGKPAPAADRIRVLPAIALLACIRYTSIMYFLHVSVRALANGLARVLHIQTLHEDHENASSDWYTGEHLWYPSDMRIACPLPGFISALRLSLRIRSLWTHRKPEKTTREKCSSDNHWRKAFLGDHFALLLQLARKAGLGHVGDD